MDKAEIMINLSKCNLFSPWYGWKFTHSAFIYNHSLIMCKMWTIL